MRLSFGKKTKSKKEPGKFIVIDGTDGSGKATQTQLLIETLKTTGYDVEVADFPQYGKKSAGPVEEHLNGKYGLMDPYAASVLYAVDRFDASFAIRQSLAEGKIVICNRYVTSNAGHQGGKIKDQADRYKYFKWLDNLEYVIFGIPKPDLTIVLHVPPETSQSLVDKKADREYLKGKKRDIYEDNLEHLRDAERSFLEIAKIFPNTKLVECVVRGRLLNPQEIHNKVWELARRIALKNTRPEPK